MPRPKIHKKSKATRTVTVTLSDEALAKAEKIQEKYDFGSLAYACRKAIEWAPPVKPKGKK